MSLLLLTALALDLSRASIVLPAGASPLEKKAAQVLTEEIEKRSQVRLGASAAPVTITLQTRANAQRPEGYTIATSATGVTITGNDGRGVIFGAGHLLRKLECRRGSVVLPADLNITTAPETKLRGHQLGYRPKTNSYDAWTVAMWDQYIRELALFGTNAIELIPPRSDDDDDSPHFPLNQLDMMVHMSRIADSYGLDVWVWYPALDEDYSKPEQVEFALKEWAGVLSKLPRVDHIFVPGGDPGHTPPQVLMPMLEKQAASIGRFHPKVGWWVAPQGFTEEWMQRFFGLLKSEPKWLTGLVYGPQFRYTLPKFRELTPARLPIRHYPDITHSMRSEYPVPDWDLALATTLQREPINPRPQDQAAIFAHTNRHTMGFLTYSEGCNDDVNKFVWSALGWNAQANLSEVLRDYGRLFVSPDLADAFAQGLFALENNWRGAAITHGGIDVTLRQFQAMEAKARPGDLLSWRFQQALYRAYYDAAVRQRLVEETAFEDQALRALRAPGPVLDRVALAEAALRQAPSGLHRARVHELGEALYQSIRMQLDSKLYQGQVGRGSNLDTLDYPLNNRVWLRHRFAEIRQANDEAQREARVQAILDWENPGPGGFYDDLGNPARQPHLVGALPYGRDPYFLASPLTGFITVPSLNLPDLHRAAWTHSEVQYDDALKLRYTGLDPAARYRLKILYSSVDAGARAAKVRCVAHGGVTIHDFVTKDPAPMEFDVPAAATSGGTLDLSFDQAPGSRGAGRGAQIAAIWLMRK